MVTNRVFKVLATNGTAMTNLADTGAGEYLVIKQDGSTVTAATALDRDEKVQIVVNSAGGVKYYSDFVRIGDITAYNTEAYAAKTEQVITFTPGTPVVGQEYSIAVIDKSDKEILQLRQAKRTYTVVATTGETATTLNDKFRALINADAASQVVASGTTTLVLTAKSVANVADQVGETPNQIVFDIFPSQINPTTYPIPVPQAFGTVAYTTAPAFGSGQYYQIAKLEQLSQGYKGITNRTRFPAPPVQYLSVAGTNYDVAVLEYDNTHDTNSVVEGEKRAPITLIVACTTGSSTGLFAILARLAGSGDQATVV